MCFGSSKLQVDCGRDCSRTNGWSKHQQGPRGDFLGIEERRLLSVSLKLVLWEWLVSVKFKGYNLVSCVSYRLEHSFIFLQEALIINRASHQWHYWLSEHLNPLCTSIPNTYFVLLNIQGAWLYLVNSKYGSWSHALSHFPIFINESKSGRSANACHCILLQK